MLKSNQKVCFYTENRSVHTVDCPTWPCLKQSWCHQQRNADTWSPSVRLFQMKFPGTSFYPQKESLFLQCSKNHRRAAKCSTCLQSLCLICLVIHTSLNTLWCQRFPINSNIQSRGWRNPNIEIKNCTPKHPFWWIFPQEETIHSSDHEDSISLIFFPHLQIRFFPFLGHGAAEAHPVHICLEIN